MATAGKLSVQVQGRFSKGERVSLYRATSDVFEPGRLGAIVATAKAGDASTVFEGLEPGRYFAVNDSGSIHAMVSATNVRQEPQGSGGGLFPGELGEHLEPRATSADMQTDAQKRPPAAAVAAAAPAEEPAARKGRATKTATSKKASKAGQSGSGASQPKGAAGKNAPAKAAKGRSTKK